MRGVVLNSQFLTRLLTSGKEDIERVSTLKEDISSTACELTVLILSISVIFHVRDGLRPNCLFGAIHSSAASDTLFFTARAARTSFRFSSFLFCKVSLCHLNQLRSLTN